MRDETYSGPVMVAVGASAGSSDERVIKEAGCPVFVQDPRLANHDGIPQIAICTGADDPVLPTYEMVDVICDCLSKGTDLQHFKKSTLVRRLAVWMSVLGVSNPDDYLKELIYACERAERCFGIKPEVACLGVRCEQEHPGKDVRIIISLEFLEDGSRLVLIEDRLGLLETREVVVSGSRSDGDVDVLDLETDLENACETIRTAAEKLVKSNEALKSSSEELRSRNQEVQSGKEDLATTNKELQCKVAELREANDYLANTLLMTNVMTLFLDDDLRLRFFTPASQRVFRFLETELGQRIDDIGGDVDMAYLGTRCGEVLTSGIAIEEEIETKRRDRRYALKIIAYSGDKASKSRGIVCTMTDITAQTEKQAELQRMMQELQHRAKNMLSSVLALVSRARRDAGADVRVLDTLSDRITALAQTNRLLAKENWRATDIHALIEPELTHVYGAERVNLAGPRIELNARAAVALGMAIHELATNAAKYGAFSQGGGRVSLSWRRIGDGSSERVVFRWIESGGPIVRSGSGIGFGSQLIASAITGSLHGSVETDWRPEGLVVEMTVPYETLGNTKDCVVHEIF